jgi:hypothetical protein
MHLRRVGRVALVLVLANVSPGCGSEVRFRPSDLVPSVLVVDWTSDVPGRSFVEYGAGRDLGTRTPSDAGGTAHHVAVLGLCAGTTYRFRAVTVDDAGRRHASRVEAFPVPRPPPQLSGIQVGGATGRDGWVLLSVMVPDQRLSWVVIVDRAGRLVWWYPADPGLMIPTAKPGRDGLSILFGEYNNEDAEVVPSIVRVAVDGGSRTVTATPRAHHDFAELPDGRLAWLGLDVRTVPYGDAGERTVAAATVEEGPEGAGPDSLEVQRVFDWFDDYPAPPSPVCPCAGREVMGLGALDWVHGNAVVYDEPNDAWFLVSRNLDQVLHVDRRTRRILQELGGAGPAAPWSHPHVTQVWDGGLVVFDNGNHRDPPASRIAEYAWDDRTVRQVWEYRPPDGRFSGFLGDVRKLDNGNYLASWTPQGLVTEVTPAGEVIWSLTVGPRIGTGRVHLLDDLYPLEAP